MDFQDFLQLPMLIGLILGFIIPLLFATFLPNDKVYNFGFKIGQKLSSKGKSVLGSTWEDAVENNLTGTIVAAANGLKDGADSDDV